MMLIFMLMVTFAWGGGGVQSSAFFDSPSCAFKSNFQHALASAL